MAVGNTKVIQVTNIAPQATKDQMQTLFGYLGKIEDIRLYPTIRDVSCPVQSRICYIKFVETNTVGIAQHMTNTVFIDRALIVIPVQNGEIPDEYYALEMTRNGTIVPGLHVNEPKLPSHVVNSVQGSGNEQVIITSDPQLEANDLPPYPPLPVNYDSTKIEEARRTVCVLNIDANTNSQDIMNFFSAAGEVKYLRMATRTLDNSTLFLVEFTDQPSVLNALKMSGMLFNGIVIDVQHSTQAILKPQAKSNEAAQKEIEEAMSRFKEAQNMISATIEPVIGMLTKDKRSSRRSRSRSRGRRRRSRSRSRSPRSRRRRSSSRSRRSRSRDRKRRSRSRKRSSSRSRRSRSPSRTSKSRRSRSKSSSWRRKSRDRDSNSRARSKERDRKSRDRSRERKRSRDRKSREKDREKSKARDKSRDKSREKEKARSKEESKERDRDKSPKEREKSKERDRSKDRESKSRDCKDKKLDKDSTLDTTLEKKSRDRSRSRSKYRSRSRDRKKRDKRRSRSRGSRRRTPSPRRRKRSRTRSKDRKRDKYDKKDSRKERDRDRDKTRDRSRSHSKVPRNYDEEEKGFEGTDKDKYTIEPETAIEKDSSEKSDNMDISNSP